MKWVNKQLKWLQDHDQISLLKSLIYMMYKRKGKDIKYVEYIRDFNVWEFKMGNDYFYSSGPGWAYDYDYLLSQFSTHLGYHYLPKEGDVVVDVGAGVGEELMIFSKRVGNPGKVFAIEAHPKTFQALTYNNSQNNFKNTELLNVAVSDVAGHIFIEDTQDSLANKVSKVQDGNTFKVQAVTIDQLASTYQLKKIDLIKVNIEGAEQLLIKGLGKSINIIRNMAISCHDFRYHNEGIEFFRTKAIVLEFLRDHNFECITRTTNNPLLDDYVYAFPRKTGGL